MHSKVRTILLGLSVLAGLPCSVNAVPPPYIVDNNPVINGTAKAVDTQEQLQPSEDVNPWSKRPVKREMSDQQITDVLVKGSVSSFTGNCPCPYSKDKETGKTCGDNSEYIKAPGELLCYPDDVTQREIFEFRAKNRIPNPGQPWMIYR